VRLSLEGKKITDHMTRANICTAHFQYKKIPIFEYKMIAFFGTKSTPKLPFRFARTFQGLHSVRLFISAA
jgi:hypothetical protein